MTGKVLVTRPLPEAGLLAAELTRRGYDVLIQPMLEIVRLSVSLPPLGSYDGLAFTSANGVHTFAALSDERTLPVFAVGGQTAAALRTLGFQEIHETSGDAAALAARISLSCPSGRHILHCAGMAIAQDLGGLLASTGIIVDRISLYDAVPAKSLSPALEQALYACTIQYALLFSTRTAKSFGTLLMESGLTEMVRSTSALCFSSAVAVEAARLRWKDISIASHPTTASLLELLPPMAS